MSEPIGVLVMAYGTASGPDDVERYYTDIRGGRAPSPQHLEELRGRYAAIGNRFPLLQITRAQAASIEAELNRDAGAGAFRSYLGMKHSAPFIDEGVERMRADGISRAVGLVMAPHWSGMSIETYAERARASIAERNAGIEFTYIKHWHDHPGFVAFLGGHVGDALAKLPEADRDGALVIFSAHSLPQRTIADGTTRCTRCALCPAGCTYEAQLRETADLVAVRLGLRAYTTGWQSAGRTADPWLGPAVEDVIREAAKDGRPAVVVCSAGFVADHLEVLYDLDIEAKGIAEEAGLGFVRTEMPNADGRFIRVLADVVRHHLAEERVGVSRPARVVVVGGGITGLVAAYRLAADRPGIAPVDVTLVEASSPLGGKLWTAEVAGLRVETGPDSFVVRKPWAVDLATELGLGPDLIVPGASGAFIWARGRLVAFPPGTAFGIPTEVETILRWPGLSLRGKLSASLDLWRRAPAAKPDERDDESLGGLLERRLGREAAQVLAGPVLAGIHAGDPARMSVAATFPELRAWEHGAGSLIRGARAASKTAGKKTARSGSEAAGPASPHLFTTVDGGLHRLVDALATRLDAADVLTGTPVERIERGVHEGHAVVAGGGRIPADAVIVTTPAAVASDALASVAPRATASLRELRAVSTATVTLVYPPGTADRLPDATGVLVPPCPGAEGESGERASSGPRTVTACTWISRKWPDASFADRAVVRSFVGRDGEQAPLKLDDDALAGAVAADVERMTPIGARPESTLVTRWPDGMPQYDVGHLDRVAAAEDGLEAEAPGVFLAGAPYGGIGIADCVRQANEAADRVRAYLDGGATKAPATDRTDQATTGR